MGKRPSFTDAELARALKAAMANSLELRIEKTKDGVIYRFVPLAKTADPENAAALGQW